MRCPECNFLNGSEAAACTECGLLLLSTLPKRRAEDLAVQKRRSSDSGAECSFCSGSIPTNAVRCRHCGEVVDEDFYRERAQRVRSRVNYASWVMYLFGLGALLVFRPVGVLSIAAGLLLSIAYYAIPVEPPRNPRTRERSHLGTLIRRQLKLERVSIPIPTLRNKRLVFVGTPLIAALIGYSANLFLLQEPVNDILKQSASFQGMKVSAHYQYYVVPGVVVYDLKSLSFRQTPIDVHTAFLEFAKTVKEKRYKRVELAYRGEPKFSIDGASFAKLGNEYSKRNFEFALYEFAALFRPANGKEPAKNTNRDALLQFHRQWYGEDLLTRTVENGIGVGQ